MTLDNENITNLGKGCYYAGITCLGDAPLYVGEVGVYWSSVSKDGSNAYDLLFTVNNLEPSDSGSKGEGISVRLVKDAN